MSEESGEKSQDDFFILFMTLSMMTMPYFIHKCDCQCGNNKYKMNSYLYSDAMCVYIRRYCFWRPGTT